MIVSEFLGINNVADSTALKPGELVSATDLDVGTGNLMSRRGRTRLKAGAAHSPYRCSFGLLVVVDNDLLLLDDDGVELRTVYETIGYTRVWYADLPDGRVAFSNGLINGVASATTTSPWGLFGPVDPGVGIAGDTPYMVTYTRTSDGRESAPTYGSMLIDKTENIIGLPALAGHTINVYLAPYGEAMFLAGSTATDTWVPTGDSLGPQYANGAVVSVPPLGTQLCAWGARMLIVDHNVLWATRPFQSDMCDLRRDFVQMADDITAVYPAAGAGIFVGTAKGMYFLAGEELDKLSLSLVMPGAVTLGSVVEIETAYLDKETRPNATRGALCIIDGIVCLIHSAGQVLPLTAGRYRREVAEVWATTRLRDNLLQYIASPAA